MYPLKDYTEPQLCFALGVYRWLNRGKLVLTEPPWTE